MAKQTTNHFLFNMFAFGGGVWGGAALKGKGNGGGMHARGHERVPRCNQTPMRTLCIRITTRSARYDHCPFSKLVRSKVSISAQKRLHGAFVRRRASKLLCLRVIEKSFCIFLLSLMQKYKSPRNLPKGAFVCDGKERMYSAYPFVAHCGLDRVNTNHS